MPPVGESALDAGDVLWVDFGHPLGREQGGRRPALVLTPSSYNAKSSLLIVCPITRTARDWPFVVPLPPVGLVTGFVLVNQVKVIDPSIRAFRRAGRVSQETLAAVQGQLAALLGLRMAW